MSRLRVTLLGCGGSGGVPLLGGPDGRGDWGHCDPSEPRNRRTRTAAVIEGPDGGRLLVDAGPDLRAQLLATGLSRLDAVLFTHAHADHILGLDDLRGVNRVLGGPLPVHATEETMAQLQARFSYAFLPHTPPFFFRPALVPVLVAYGERFQAVGLEVQTFCQDHKVMRTVGLRIGSFAYSTDVVTLPERSLEALTGLDTWVVGCFHRQAHPVHADLDRVLDWVARLRPHRTVLTHMGPTLDYGALCRELPTGVEPGYDGMVLDVPWE